MKFEEANNAEKSNWNIRLEVTHFKLSITVGGRHSEGIQICSTSFIQLNVWLYLIPKCFDICAKILFINFYIPFQSSN